VVGTRLLLAVPVLMALAIASISNPAPPPAPPAAAAPTKAPPAAPAPATTPPAARPPGHRADDDCPCSQQLMWEECEPAWHHDQQSDETPRKRGRRPAPGTQDGPI
jgi:hypothetical protein